MQTQLDILVLNGPNLKYLGLRQPELYGSHGMESVPELLRLIAPDQAAGIRLSFAQHNHEGGLIDRLEQARSDGVHGVVLNAGAYAHSSLALADCLAWIGLPTVEVHLTNVQGRLEPERHKSVIAGNCLGVIAGFGINSYIWAIMALYEHIKSNHLV